MKTKIWILALLAATILVAMPATAVEVRGVPFDQSSAKYNNTLSWDAETFPGFWYAFPVGISSEILKIDQLTSSLTPSNREIKQKNLIYETIRTAQKYRAYIETGKEVENGLEYNSTAKTFAKATQGGYYARLGWLGNLYVAVNGKANKLSKLVKEQRKEEKQTLKLGESWNLGDGYSLVLESIDARVTPRQAWIRFSKENKTLDDGVVNEGTVYVYMEKSLRGETNVPMLVTYVESIFAGTPDMIQLRYTYLISHNVTEIKVGDKFGVFEVKEADESHLLLYNKDKAIGLDQNTVVDLADGIKFRVADSATALRFYPFKDIKDPAPQTMPEATTATPIVIMPPANKSVETGEDNKSAVPTLTTPLPTATPQKIEPAKTEKMIEPTPQKTPGFEGVCLITAVALAVAIVRNKSVR